jgi:hypothetical protein
MACLANQIPGKDTISKSLHKTLDYAEELRAAVTEPEESMRRACVIRPVVGNHVSRTQEAGDGPRSTSHRSMGRCCLTRGATLVQHHGDEPGGSRNLAGTKSFALDYGIDAVAMALDASASIEAANSLEKMLAHQLAVAHINAMEQIGRAHGACAPDTEIKRLNVATRFMSVFQQGLLTLKKLRQGGRQQITVQYVNVSHGSQAVIGSVENAGRGQRGSGGGSA